MYLVINREHTVRSRPLSDPDIDQSAEGTLVFQPVVLSLIFFCLFILDLLTGCCVDWNGGGLDKVSAYDDNIFAFYCDGARGTAALPPDTRWRYPIQWRKMASSSVPRPHCWMQAVCSSRQTPAALATLRPDCAGVAARTTPMNGGQLLRTTIPSQLNRYPAFV